MRGAKNGTGEPHAEIDTHAVVAHYAVEMCFVGCEVEVCEEAEGPEGKGKDGRDNALEEPGGVKDGAVAAEGEDEVERFRGGPAEVRGPVFEHAFVARGRGEEGGGVEAFGGAELGVDVDCHA